MAQPEMEGSAPSYLEITLQLPSHTTTLETVNCFVAPFAEKKSIFPRLSRSHSLFQPPQGYSYISLTATDE